MVEEPQCPESCRLQALMEGGISEDEQAAVASHLADCESCQSHFEKLLGQSDLLSPAAKELVSREDRPETALQRAIEQLRAGEARAGDDEWATVPPGEAVPSSGEDVLLDILEPSEQPEHLGRLGPYEILEIVGYGGMGVVLKGREKRLDRCVAIKVLNPRLASNATARKRFRRESRAAAAVAHDHVVTIHAVDEIRGLPLLVMEYIEGTSLQKRINDGGPLELEEILRVGMQTAHGLAAAHSQGLIHRDVKPSNILLENGVERVKLTDFGLARAVDDVQLTQSGYLTGTPEYMSPEQARGEVVDRRSDLFSLGCLLYATCTGRSPFRAASTMAALRRVLDDTPRPIREINPGIPEWLVEIIDRLLAKDRDQRFQSAAEVAQHLGDHLAHLQHPSEVPRPARLARLARGGSRRPRTWLGGRHWVMASALMLVALAAGFGVTEGTGVTQVVPTIIELWTPKGTLVLEVHDPGVEVAVKGNGEELTISGAGVHKLTVQVGEYEVRAAKDGELCRQQLVKITRGGREVVEIDRLAPEETPRKDAVAWHVAEGGNGHRYEVFVVPEGICWAEANRRAVDAGGHLVTITSQAENDFVFALVDQGRYWHRPEGWAITTLGPWLGGFQTPGSREPDGGWEWVTGEPFAFTNWAALGKPPWPEPNDIGCDWCSGPMDRIRFCAKEPRMRSPWWIDARGSCTHGTSYVVEFDEFGACGEPLPGVRPTGEWVSLFNGRDLAGWKTRPDRPGRWAVEDRMLVGRGTPGGGLSWLFRARSEIT